MGSVMYFISYMAPFCDLVRTKMQIFCGLFMVHPDVDKTQHCQATALAWAWQYGHNAQYIYTT